MAYKKFKEVKEGAFIFQINPYTLQIDELPVIEIKGHPKFPRFILLTYKRMDPQVLAINPDHKEYTDLILDGNATMVVTQTTPPVPISADKDYLKEWMAKTS